jgi:hypothetical protein
MKTNHAIESFNLAALLACGTAIEGIYAHYEGRFLDVARTKVQ